MNADLAQIAQKSWTEHPYLNSAVALLAICGAAIVPFPVADVPVADALDAAIRSAAITYVLATVAPWWGKQEV